MATNKKPADEEVFVKTLREMAALPHNRQCFDCGQRGPTYIDMTVGSFVCMTCSGLLRGLNPPHRVKSISVASFTAEEMDFIQSRGNDFCRKVWLSSRPVTPFDSKDELRIRDTMSEKYEKKRWYVPPQKCMYEEARKQNTTTSDAKQASSNKPLSSMIGNSPPILSSPDGQVLRHGLTLHSSSIQRPTGVGSIQLASAAQMTSSLASPRSPITRSPTSQSQTTSAKPVSVDLLSDLGSDPFASTSPPQQAANFSPFATFSSSQEMASPTASNPLQPINHHSSVAMATQNTPTATDKYSALAELDDAFSCAASATKVNWDAPLMATTPGSRQTLSWASSPSTPLPSGSPFGVAGNGVAGSNPFGMATSAQSIMYNPFVGNMMVSPGYGGQPGSTALGQFGPQSNVVGFGYGQFCAVPFAMSAGNMTHPGGVWNQPLPGANPFMSSSVNGSYSSNPFM